MRLNVAFPSAVSEFAILKKKYCPSKSQAQAHSHDSIPVSIKGLIAKANAGVDQGRTTLNGQKILVWIKTGSCAGGVTKHRATATVTVTTAVHFYSWNGLSSTIRSRL